MFNHAITHLIEHMRPSWHSRLHNKVDELLGGSFYHRLVVDDVVDGVHPLLVVLLRGAAQQVGLLASVEHEGPSVIFSRRELVRQNQTTETVQSDLSHQPAVLGPVVGQSVPRQDIEALLTVDGPDCPDVPLLLLDQVPLVEDLQSLRVDAAVTRL